VRWDRDPFQHADKVEWRLGWFVVMCFPLIMFLTCSTSARSFAESTADGKHSVVWLYICFIGLAAGGVFGAFMIGPKIPLFISIPIAIIAWILCIWLLGFHPEKVMHSNL
jgi:hypothetical protein